MLFFEKLVRPALLLLLLLLAVPRAGFAQIADFSKALCDRQESVSENHWKCTGDVELSRDDLTFFADEVEFFNDTKRLVASGNVLFAQADHRISADRADFNTQTRLGTFFDAWGVASMGARADASLFGTLEPDVYFYGRTIEKIAADRYRITKGGFTTCVQPTPRWELVSGSVVLKVDDYALLRNSVLKVKHMPVLFLPVMYYPINKEDRATGLLMPSYGMSTIKGQTLSNAFFWAVDRSQDVTVFHDWFSRTGQALGGEYRYALEQGSGNLWTNYLNEHEATYTVPGAENATTVPSRRSYELRGTLTQGFGTHLTARSRVAYFSNLAVRETYTSDIAVASDRRRSLSGGLNGTWGAYSIGGAFDRSEHFADERGSSVNGTAPRLTAARAERPFGRTRLYSAFTGEYVHLLRQNRTGVTVRDQSIDRVDVASRLRFPFTRWRFLTITSSLLWRNTFWSDSRDVNHTRMSDPIARRYFDMQAQIVGPVLIRIWDTPESSYASRFKHSIEPFLTLQRTTAIDMRDRIVRLEGTDYTVGDTTRYIYGIHNRLYAKRSEGGPSSTAREILTASIQQTYYTDPNAAQVDLDYRTSPYGRVPPTHFSPISMTVRATPTAEMSATFRTDYDTQFSAFRTLSADGALTWSSWLQANAGWSYTRFVPDELGRNDASRQSHVLNSNTTVRFRQNRFGAIHAVNLDIHRKSLLQQRIAGFYNAQCCGFSAEFQTFNFSGLGRRSPVVQDRRFNVSVTLAGLGSFSNFFGTQGGTSR